MRKALPENLTSLTSLSDPTTEPAFSPDGSRVAFRRESFVPGSSGLYVKRVGGEELAQLTNDRGDCCPVWSPDGRSLAFSRFSDHERTIYEVPVAGGELHRLFSSGLGPKRGELDWSPDGKSIVFVGGASEEGPASLRCHWKIPRRARSRFRRRSRGTGVRHFRRMVSELSLFDRAKAAFQKTSS